MKKAPVLPVYFQTQMLNLNKPLPAHKLAFWAQQQWLLAHCKQLKLFALLSGLARISVARYCYMTA
jgi:hypothetical protein